MCVVRVRVRCDDGWQERFSYPMPRPWCEHALRLLRARHPDHLDRIDLQVLPA